MERELTEKEDEEISKFAYIMAQQWADWPCFILSNIGQLFLLIPYSYYSKLFFTSISIHNKLFSLNFHLNNIIILFILAEIIWFFTAEKLVSFKLMFKTRWIGILGMVTSPAAAIILFMHKHIFIAVVALLWYFILIILSGAIFMLLSLFFGWLYSLEQPRIEIMQIKMKAQIMGLSEEETDYYVNIATKAMRDNKL